jgi:RNA methyltransferase, TrmH family
VGRRKDEQVIVGVHAVEMCFQVRPESIRRAFFTMQQAKRFGSLMSYCAQKRLPYRVVEPEELQKITSTAHHEGACAIVDVLPAHSFDQWLRKHEGNRACCGLALQDVENPHNLGALLRSAAHFGIHGILTPQPDRFSSSAVARTAQGGGEYVSLVKAEFPRQIKQAHTGSFQIVATSSHCGVPLFEADLSPRCIVLLGSEQAGLSDELLSESDLTVQIPGTGNVESLNVSVAGALLLAEWFRRQIATPEQRRSDR